MHIQNTPHFIGAVHGWDQNTLEIHTSSPGGSCSLSKPMYLLAASLGPWCPQLLQRSRDKSFHPSSVPQIQPGCLGSFLLLEGARPGALRLRWCVQGCTGQEPDWMDLLSLPLDPGASLGTPEVP